MKNAPQKLPCWRRRAGGGASNSRISESAWKDRRLPLAYGKSEVDKVAQYFQRVPCPEGGQDTCLC
eukprot:8995794-Pyramimonas_sp.AAC.1